jgi:hypothetical protein
MDVTARDLAHVVVVARDEAFRFTIADQTRQAHNEANVQSPRRCVTAMTAQRNGCRASGASTEQRVSRLLDPDEHATLRALLDAFLAAHRQRHGRDEGPRAKKQPSK